MTHEQAFRLMEDILDKYIPIDARTDSVKARRAIRTVALSCAWPATYNLEELLKDIEQ